MHEDEVLEIYGQDPFGDWIACAFQALALGAISKDAYLLTKDAGELWAADSGWGKLLSSTKFEYGRPTNPQ
jgi:hypothetical protein